MSGQETLAELFARDPFAYAKHDTARITEAMRQARTQFKLTGKATAEKRPVDLKELGLLE